MNNFDYLALDGRLLRQFLAVYDTGSVTAAADSLGLTQSNISHNLERLNQLTGSRLFTRRGRGIVATEHGHTLAPRARRILQELAEIATQPDYRPAEDTGRFVIACNDYEREVLVKPLLAVLQKEAPRCQLRCGCQPDVAGAPGCHIACEARQQPAQRVRSLPFTDTTARAADPSALAPATSFLSQTSLVAQPGQTTGR